MSGGVKTANKRAHGLALRRGWRGQCPACGCSGLCEGLQCRVCGVQSHAGQVASAVPLIVAPLAFGLAAGLAVLAELFLALPLGLELLLSEGVALTAALALLPRVKGALIGHAWALGLEDEGCSRRAMRVSTAQTTRSRAMPLLDFGGR